MNDSEDNLEKVYVDLPNNSSIGGESMWAKPLGNDLYELYNAPFYAYGLNYFDVVKVNSNDKTQKPQVLEVVKNSGYSTLRVVFGENFDRQAQTELFNEITEFKAEVERATERYVAIFIEPNGNYDAVYDKLLELENKGVLEFETCEARNEHNFDAATED